MTLPRANFQPAQRTKSLHRVWGDAG